MRKQGPLVNFGEDASGLVVPRDALSALIKISIGEQRLDYYVDGVPHFTCAVSTSLREPSEQSGSYGTPRGWHYVRAKIGEGTAYNTVFVGRRPTGELWSETLHATFPERDWILTRILWLSGLERGKNRGGSVDTFRRLVYIHGAPDCVPMGVPGSKGCVRLSNRDIVCLSAMVPVGTRVLIVS